MKGFLDKRENEWFLMYVTLSTNDFGTIIKELPLHPDSLKEMIDLSQSFDNLDEKIFEKPRVEFTIIEECSNYDGKHFGKDCGCKEGFVQYAKIIKINEL
jgi:hypothetical protein